VKVIEFGRKTPDLDSAASIKRREHFFFAGNLRTISPMRSPHGANTKDVAIDFAQAAAQVNDYLNEIIARTIEIPANLQDAVNYSLLAGGKRLRPALVLLSCQVSGGEPTASLAPAAAIEMIHCFSLVHDDLPAMDDDDLRRGQPTNHRKFGEAMAILAGDALATLPYLVITQSDDLDDHRKRQLAHELADATMRMIAGQVYDTLGGFAESFNKADQLKITHQHKTGALIRCACRMGAIVADSDDDHASRLNALTKYGEAIGLMFQIVDDVLDVTQTTEHLGKRTGKDEAAGKLTYPSVLGLDESRKRIADLQRDALAALKSFEESRAIPLADLVDLLAGRTK